MWHKVILIIATLSVASAKFPDDPKPCKYGDAACLTERINFFLSELYNGDKTTGLFKIDPLTVNKINIKQGADSPVNIDLTFTKNQLIGLKNAKVLRVRGFGKDLTTKSEILFKVDKLMLVGDYSINGKILILPISGSGKSNMTITNLEFVLVFNGTPLEKDGSTYMTIKNMRTLMKPERLYYEFTNLFNGDKALGDNMNLFLNENWKEIYDEVKNSIQNAFGSIFEQVINNVFATYPYEKFFAPE